MPPALLLVPRAWQAPPGRPVKPGRRASEGQAVRRAGRARLRRGEPPVPPAAVAPRDGVELPAAAQVKPRAAVAPRRVPVPGSARSVRSLGG